MPVSIESPYYDGPDALWLRGNLHTHTTRSDGSLPPQETVDRYKAAGYDFLMLSDHDTLGPPAGLDAGGMLLIPGNEISAGGSHMLHVGAKSRIEPCADRQQVIDAINAEGGLAILCHPNWQSHYNHYTYEQLIDLDNYAGIEILNGTCMRLQGEARATDKWDRLLAAGRKVWGYGTDDRHKEWELALAWTVVRAKGRSVESVVDALKAGSCYVSNGVAIEQIRCTGSTLHVYAPTAQGMAVFGECGARLHYQLGNEIYFDVAEVPAGYVRVECYGRANEMAWTQPFVIRGGKADRLRQLSEDRPVLRAARTADEVDVTGRLDDATWQQAESSTRFLDMATAWPASVETSLRCLVTPTHLHLGIRCNEPHMDRLRTSVTADGDPNLWNDDGVELFIDPGASRKRYLHVMVSAAGYAFATWMPPQGSASPDVRVAAVRDADGYSLQVALPLSQLGAESAGQEWGLHACRNRKTESATCMWAWVGTSNHAPWNFGRLILP